MAAPVVESVHGTTSATAGTTTTVSVDAGTDELLIVGFAKRASGSITGPSLSGVTFNPVLNTDGQFCAARAQTYPFAWWGYGSWSAGTLTFTHASVAQRALIVARISGVDPSDPLTFVKRRNTLGDAGACTGGTDGNAPSITFSSTDDDQRLVVMSTLRNRSFDTGATGASGWTRDVERATGTGGSDCDIALFSRTLTPAGSASWSASVNTTVDWALLAMLLNPVPPPVTASVTAGPTPSRISTVSGKNSSDITFTVTGPVTAWEIRKVASSGAARSTSDPLVKSGGSVASSQAVTITGSDLVAAGLGDGTHTLKVFGQNAGGWSS